MRNTSVLLCMTILFLCSSMNNSYSHSHTQRTLYPSFHNNSFTTFSPDARHTATRKHQRGKSLIYRDGKLQASHNDTSSLTWSPDSQSLAYIVENDKSHHVVWNDKKGPQFPKVLVDLYFSPTSKLLIYNALNATSQLKYIVASATKTYQSEYFDTVVDPVFSKVGNRYALHGKWKNKEVLIIDGKRLGPFQWVPTPPIFSQDGKSVAYAVRALNGKMYVYHNTKRYGPYYMLSRESDGTTIAFDRAGHLYVAIQLGWGKAAIYKDGKRISPIVHGINTLALSPDQSEIYASIRKREGMPTYVYSNFIFFRGKVLPHPKGVVYTSSILRFRYCNQGPTVAYTVTHSEPNPKQALQEDRTRLILHKQVSTFSSWHLYSSNLQFRSDGKRWIYKILSRDRREAIVIGQMKGSKIVESIGSRMFKRDGKYNSIIESLIMSKDGSQYAYIANGMIVHWNRKPGNIYKHIYTLSFVENIPVYRAYKEYPKPGYFVVIGHKEYGPFPTMSKLVFTQKGKVVSFGAIEKKKHVYHSIRLVDKGKPTSQRSKRRKALKGQTIRSQVRPKLK